jgi:hypothetical protein
VKKRYIFDGKSNTNYNKAILGTLGGGMSMSNKVEGGMGIYLKMEMSELSRNFGGGIIIHDLKDDDRREKR